MSYVMKDNFFSMVPCKAEKLNCITFHVSCSHISNSNLIFIHVCSCSECGFLCKNLQVISYKGWLTFKNIRAVYCELLS